MGLFSKKESQPKEQKSNCYFGERLSEKTAQKQLKRANLLGGLPDPSRAKIILGTAALSTVANCAICTDKELVYIASTNSVFRPYRYNLSDITAVSLSGSGLYSANVVISLGGSRDVELDIKAIRQDTEKFYNYLRSVVGPEKAAAPAAPAAPAPSAADEIKKFKELLDIGAITQEEFDAKKKQLLGL